MKTILDKLKRMSDKLNIKLQKRALKNAYVDYVNFIGSFSCGEQLALDISSTAQELRKKLEEEHKKMCELDHKCPPLTLNLIQ